MATELYDLSVPVFVRALSAMAAFLEKGRAYAAERDIAESELIDAKLYEDMKPLPYQVQRACDAAKLAVVRLGQVENEPMEDNETSFAELQDRIARTIAFLNRAPRAVIDGREEATIAINLPSRSFEMAGRAYLLSFTLPNFFFHVTTAYAILRNQGVPVGKMDFLGGAPGQS